jgi:hypothetical protein
MRCEQADSDQLKPAIRDGREELRKPPCRPCCLDSLERRILRQTQIRDAIRVHRGIASRSIQTPDVDLGDVREDLRHRQAIARNQCREIAQQRRVADMGQRVALHDVPASGQVNNAWRSIGAFSLRVFPLYHDECGGPRALSRRSDYL